jgi:hypothetical protein
MKKAELEKVVAELAFENGALRNELTALRKDFDRFVELDDKWSRKIGEGLTATMKGVMELHETVNTVTAMIVYVMKADGKTLEEAMAMVAEAEAAARTAEEMVKENCDVQH